MDRVSPLPLLQRRVALVPTHGPVICEGSTWPLHFSKRPEAKLTNTEGKHGAFNVL